MRAVRLTGIDQLSLASVPDPVPGPGEALVSVKAAALNHRDVWIKSGHYAAVKYPCIPGSDGAGVVAAVGPETAPDWVGREVIINPSLGWGDSERAQGNDFSILGLPRDGTLAERVVVPAGQIFARPAHLSWREAAALPLAGLTAFRALFSRAQLRAGERVLISGVGGGVALLGLQMAVALGFEVWATSGSEEKVARAVRLGARGGFLYSRPGWPAEAARVAGPFDVILDSAGGEGFGDLVDLAAPGGRIVFFGATRGNVPELALRKVFWRQISLLGSTMGSPGDWVAMTELVSRRKIRPIVDASFPFSRAAEAFELMERGGQFGKIVVHFENES
jgi:NADPH:quinone reductase-like Zn-dependent oxidoreductase